MKTKQLIILLALIVPILAAGCEKKEPASSPLVIISTPAGQTPGASPTSTNTMVPTNPPTVSPTIKNTPTQAPTPIPTPVKTAAPTVAPPTSTPTPVPATPTASPSPSPVETVEIIELPIDFQDPGYELTFNSRKPLPQVSFKVVDPENKRGLSTTKISHWFGKDTPAQPLRFQRHYEEMAWSGLTVDAKTKEKIIYLTFDCGYENGYTAKILDVLKEKNVPAAFFPTLGHLKEAPELIARMIAEGHIVGNHSCTHPDFSSISRTRMAHELQRYENYMRIVFGYSTKYFRYPAGAYSDSSMELLTSLGYHSIFWSFAYDDYNENVVHGKEYTFHKVTKSLHPGEVLLLHAISQDNAEALPEIIDYAREQGYEFRPLSAYFE